MTSFIPRHWWMQHWCVLQRLWLRQHRGIVFMQLQDRLPRKWLDMFRYVITVCLRLFLVIFFSIPYVYFPHWCTISLEIRKSFSAQKPPFPLPLSLLLSFPPLYNFTTLHEWFLFVNRCVPGLLGQTQRNMFTYWELLEETSALCLKVTSENDFLASISQIIFFF